MATFTFLVFLDLVVAIVFVYAASTRFREARRFRDAADLLNAIRTHPSSIVPGAVHASTPSGNLGKASPPVVTPGLVEVPADAEVMAASAGVTLPGSVTDPNGRGSRRPWKDPS